MSDQDARAFLAEVPDIMSAAIARGWAKPPPPPPPRKPAVRCPHESRARIATALLGGGERIYTKAMRAETGLAMHVVSKHLAKFSAAGWITRINAQRSSFFHYIVTDAGRRELEALSKETRAEDGR